MNQVAFGFGNLAYSGDQNERLELVTYDVHLDALSILLPPIDAYCFHERVQVLKEAFVIFEDGSDDFLTEVELQSYGI